VVVPVTISSEATSAICARAPAPGSMNITAPMTTNISPLKVRSSFRPPLTGR
jgi:hypothetical protein